MVGAPKKIKAGEGRLRILRMVGCYFRPAKTSLRRKYLKIFEKDKAVSCRDIWRKTFQREEITGTKALKWE